MDLMKTLSGLLTPEMTQKISQMTGATPQQTTSALSSAFPTILAGLMGKLGSDQGSFGTILEMIKKVSSSSDMFSNAQTSTQTGTNFLNTLFGDKLNTVVQGFSTHANINTTTSQNILSAGSNLVMGTLGKVNQTQGLTASSLLGLLTQNKSSIMGMLPSGLGSMLNLSSIGNVAGLAQQAGGGFMKKLIPLAAVLALAFFGIKYYGKTAVKTVQETASTAVEATKDAATTATQAASDAAATVTEAASDAASTVTDAASTAASNAAKWMDVTLPNGTKLNLEEGTINYTLAKFLESTDQTALPQTFVFDHLNFDTGATTVTTESKATVETLSQILKAYPNATISLVGHTDNTGDAAENKTLSANRAEAVKKLLTEMSVNDARIATIGMGSETPLADNTTEEGRAKNRRLEVAVTKK